MTKKQYLKKLGKLIKSRRKSLDLTQVELAKKMKTSQKVIVRLEKGQSAPTLTTLLELSQALDWEIDLQFNDPKTGAIETVKNQLEEDAVCITDNAINTVKDEILSTIKDIWKLD